MKNKGKHMSKRVKLPLRAYLLYLLVASFLMTGVTFSKYIAASTGGDSARVATIQELSITESEGNYDTDNDGKKEWVVIPGVDLKKDAKVSFGGSEAATYVFVKITAEKWTVGEDNKTYTISDGNTELMSFAVADGWSYLAPGVYYKTVAPNTALNEAVIKDGTITVTRDVTEANIEKTESSITLRAYAVQSSGFASAQDAWNSVSEKTN